MTLLRAAGLVRLEGSLLDEPVRVRPIASILNLFPAEETAPFAGTAED